MMAITCNKIWVKPVNMYNFMLEMYLLRFKASLAELFKICENDMDFTRVTDLACLFRVLI